MFDLDTCIADPSIAQVLMYSLLKSLGPTDIKGGIWIALQQSVDVFLSELTLLVGCSQIDLESGITLGDPGQFIGIGKLIRCWS